MYKNKTPQKLVPSNPCSQSSAVFPMLSLYLSLIIQRVVVSVGSQYDVWVVSVVLSPPHRPFPNGEF